MPMSQQSLNSDVVFVRYPTEGEDAMSPADYPQGLHA